MDRLRNELIIHDELPLARNVMLGSFLRSLSNLLVLAEKFKGIHECEDELDYNYYDRFPDSIKMINLIQPNEFTNKHFQRKDIHELLVGKK